MKEKDATEDLKRAALDYHELPTPGKISITATKQLVNQSDLALAYSPGVAAACEAIVKIRSMPFALPPGATWSESSATAARYSAWGP